MCLSSACKAHAPLQHLIPHVHLIRIEILVDIKLEIVHVASSSISMSLTPHPAYQVSLLAHALGEAFCSFATSNTVSYSIQCNGSLDDMIRGAEMAVEGSDNACSCSRLTTCFTQVSLVI